MSSIFFFSFLPRILTRLLTRPGLDSKNYNLPLRPHWLGFAANGAHQDPAPGKSLSVCLPDTMLRFQPQFMRSSTFALLFIRSTLKAPLDSVTIDKEHIDEILHTMRTHTHSHAYEHIDTLLSHTCWRPERHLLAHLWQTIYKSDTCRQLPEIGWRQCVKSRRLILWFFFFFFFGFKLIIFPFFFFVLRIY